MDAELTHFVDQFSAHVGTMLDETLAAAMVIRQGIPDRAEFVATLAASMAKTAADCGDYSVLSDLLALAVTRLIERSH